MQTKHFFRPVLLLVCAFILFPSQSQAYGVTESHKTNLSDTVTMYTLTFKFGFLNADMWMPISASDTYTVDGSKTSSIILSTSKIQDNKYFVPKKATGTFTLLVLEEHAVGKSRGSIAVEKLPVTLQKEGEKKIHRTFTKEELKDFEVK